MNENLEEQVDSLRRQNFILMLALIVVSGTVATYLAYQSRTTGKILEATRQQTAPIIQVYNQIEPHINHQQLDTFKNQLIAYATAHPDFQPVLEKYGWHPTPPTAPAVAPKK